MAASPETVSMAMFCDFENVALGVRDAKFDKFDIKPVLERLLLKGSIVVKKAYCDWERYKGFKAAMHEANFELIEIPHVRQSGKNSADIRMVVDALDLCYTKSHVNTFVIVSGDSDLLIANCDEFIFYDDLARESQRAVVRRDPKAVQTMPRLSPEELEARKAEAIELAVATFEALAVERGESGKIWASMLKEAMKRRKPDFNESHFGFRSFGNLLDEAQVRGLLEVGRDEKSGAFVSRSTAPGARPEAPLPLADEPVPAEPALPEEETASTVPHPATGAKRRGRGRGKSTKEAAPEAVVQVTEPAPDLAPSAGDASLETAVPLAEIVAEQGAEPEKSGDADVSRKRPAPRSRRPRKPKASPASESDG